MRIVLKYQLRTIFVVVFMLSVMFASVKLFMHHIALVRSHRMLLEWSASFKSTSSGYAESESDSNYQVELMREGNAFDRWLPACFYESCHQNSVIRNYDYKKHIANPILLLQLNPDISDVTFDNCNLSPEELKMLSRITTLRVIRIEGDPSITNIDLINSLRPEILVVINGVEN